MTVGLHKRGMWATSVPKTQNGCVRENVLFNPNIIIHDLG